jgi:hypothetical protein
MMLNGGRAANGHILSPHAITSKIIPLVMSVP